MEVIPLGSKIYEKGMRFCVHHAYLITVMSMFLDHLILLFLLSIDKVVPLVHFNVLSVIVYLFCLILCKIGYVKPVYFSILLEVTSYAIIGVYYTGLQGCTEYFLCAILPVTIYFGYNLLQPHTRSLIAILLICNFSIFCMLYFNFKEYKPIYELSEPIETSVFILTLFTMFFSIIFYNTIYIYSAEFKRRSLEASNKVLTDNANTDTLTGLLNRRGFLDMFSEDSKTLDTYSVAFCDIDNFKRVNDTYGHEGGDEILRSVAELLQRNLGDTAKICRWGGEEMVIFLPNCNLAQAKNEMEFIRTTVEQHSTVFYNKHIGVTLTVGVAERGGSLATLDAVINRADERMYWGKTHGKNQVVAI